METAAPEQIAQQRGSSSSEPTVLTEQELATRLSLSVATLRAWRRRGVGPRFVRFGRAVRYLVDDVEQFVSASRVETSSITMVDPEIPEGG